MRIFNKQNKSVTVAFVCLCLRWCAKWHARNLTGVSYCTTRVPNDTLALSLACDYDTHTWVQDEREMNLIVTRVVFVRFVCSIVKHCLVYKQTPHGRIWNRSLRRRLHELFHPGMKSSRGEHIFAPNHVSTYR